MKTQVRSMLAACRNARWWIICMDAVVPLAVVLAVVDMSSVASLQEGGPLTVGSAWHASGNVAMAENPSSLSVDGSEQGREINSEAAQSEACGKQDRLMSKDDPAIERSACMEGVATSGAERPLTDPVGGLRGTLAGAGLPPIPASPHRVSIANVTGSVRADPASRLVSRLDRVNAGVWAIRGDATDERWHIADEVTPSRGAS